MKIGTGASGNKDRRDTVCVIQLLYPVNKRHDRLGITVDHALHQFVTDHKIRCTGILVDQKCSCACLHRLDHICCLGSTPAGILRIKGYRIFPVWQVMDKHGNIHVTDASSILGTDLHCCIVRDDILPAIPCNVVIDTCLKRF